jgi:hypothetical protein
MTLYFIVPVIGVKPLIFNPCVFQKLQSSMSTIQSKNDKSSFDNFIIIYTLLPQQKQIRTAFLTIFPSSSRRSSKQYTFIVSDPDADLFYLFQL